jgi:hypothetical protein
MDQLAGVIEPAPTYILLIELYIERNSQINSEIMKETWSRR